MSQPRPLQLRSMHLLAFCAFVASTLLHLACGQRYAERNVLPAPSPADEAYHTYDDYNYDGDYEGKDANPYGGFFDLDETSDVFKWTVDQYPHPVNTPKFCNRFKPSHVCDPDLVLDKSQADLLDEYIRKLYRETPCICDTCEGESEGGIVVGIALLKYLHHPYHMHHAKVIRSFAETLRRKWKLGHCDNDILIVVATTDRLSYTDVGRATSTYLSVHEAHRIFLENKSKFTAFNFSEGLMDILRGYHRATRGMQLRTELDGQGGVDMFAVAGTIVGSVLLLGVILFLGFVVYRRWCRNRKDQVDDTEPKKPGTGRGTTVSRSWSKKDIKVLFGPEKSAGPKRSSAKYQKCGTADENDNGTGSSGTKDDQEMDFTLASPDDASFPDQTRLTNVTSDSVELEKDLDRATEGLVKTFPVTGPDGHRVLVTDM